MEMVNANNAGLPAMQGNESSSPLMRGLQRLPVMKQMGLIIGAAVGVALIAVVLLWSFKPNYGVLFGNLGDKESAEIAQVLQQQKIEYRIDEHTGAIMVPANRIHDVRLQLASMGLPKSSGMGLEILQQKPEFGTSQFLETTRYQHALEGELARSIMTINSVESARVHLAVPKQSVFVRKRELPSASVLVNLYAGRNLEEGQVAAITHMVASSIPSLEPARVTVVDQKGNLLSKPKRNEEIAVNQEQFDYTRRLEENFVERIESILSPIVGHDGVRAEVNADMDFTVTEQTQETYNPDLPALRSEQVSEEVTHTAGVAGIPGALSNQPPAAGVAPERAANAATQAQNAEAPANTRKNTTNNYELDRTISHSKLASGVVKRLSIAVVVDDKVVVAADGTTAREARTEDEIQRITALVKEAVGYNVQRGDTVNVISASFAPPVVAEAPALPVWEQPWMQDLAKIAGGLLLALLFILMVLRPILRSLVAVSSAEHAVAAGGGTLAVEGAGGLAEDQLTLGGAMPGVIKLPGPGAYEENVKLVQQIAKDDPKLVAQAMKTLIASE